MSASAEPKFSPAELAWLDEACSRWVPLSERQAAVIRRVFRPEVDRKAGAA